MSNSQNYTNVNNNLEIIVNIIFLEGKMGTRRYIISDASKMLKVESHVLRYWEEELEIKIPRNEMGHRYYTEENIEGLLQSSKRSKL